MKKCHLEALTLTQSHSNALTEWVGGTNNQTTQPKSAKHTSPSFFPEPCRCSGWNGIDCAIPADAENQQSVWQAVAVADRLFSLQLGRSRDLAVRLRSAMEAAREVHAQVWPGVEPPTFQAISVSRQKFQQILVCAMYAHFFGINHKSKEKLHIYLENCASLLYEKLKSINSLSPFELR